MAWHQGHHQLCSDTITNFFSSAARWKVASDQALQKPSLLRSLRSSGGPAAALEAKRAKTARKLQNRFITRSAADLECMNAFAGLAVQWSNHTQTQDRE